VSRGGHQQVTSPLGCAQRGASVSWPPACWLSVECGYRRRRAATCEDTVSWQADAGGGGRGPWLAIIYGVCPSGSALRAQCKHCF